MNSQQSVCATQTVVTRLAPNLFTIGCMPSKQRRILPLFFCGLLMACLVGCSSTQQSSEPENPLAGFHAPPEQDARMKEIRANTAKERPGAPSKRGFESSFEVLSHARNPAPASSATGAAQ